MSLPEHPSLEHHVGGSPPTSFRNPWPSFHAHGLLNILGLRFGSDRNFVPVPDNREGLVEVVKPSFGRGPEAKDSNGSKLKATWIGHASWLVEFAAPEGDGTTATTRGVTGLLDPVFSERTSPVKWAGPKRYTPTPCTIAELPEVDFVAISHNHYDHLDYDSIVEIRGRFPRLHYFCGLNGKEWFVNAGIPAELVHELDWWQAATVTVRGAGSVAVVCTPAQHLSRRGAFDNNKALWTSWAFGEISELATDDDEETVPEQVFVRPLVGKTVGFTRHRLWFAGDTGYRAVDSAQPTDEEEATKPRCPAFKDIGDRLGPFDLAMLPIGLCTPRNFMSSVHCAPADSVCLHKDVKSRRSVGMHYGTVRGGISAQYENVLDPPRWFEEQSKKAGLRWGEEIGLCAIGETVLVD